METERPHGRHAAEEVSAFGGKDVLMLPNNFTTMNQHNRDPQ